MSHELDFSLGKAAIAYFKGSSVPWHGYGESITADMTAAERMAAAGINFEVQRAAIRYPVNAIGSAALDGKGREGSGKVLNLADYRVLTDKHILFRSDDQSALGVVSAGYNVVQPEEVDAFFGNIAKDSGLRIEVMGALKGGRIVWSLARVDEKIIELGSDDQILPYFLITTSFDGSLATTVMPTVVRVVCMNTLRGSGAISGRKGTDYNEKTNTLRVSHRSVFDSLQARHVVGLDTFAAQWAAIQENIGLLARTQLTTAKAQAFVESLIVADAKILAKLKDEDKMPAAVDGIMANFLKPDSTSTDGTAWGLANAVSHWTDHDVGARSTDNRFLSATSGAGAALKDKAVARLLEMAHV